MPVRPRPGTGIPELTAQVARVGNPAGMRRCGCGTGPAACGTTRTSPGGIPGIGAGISPARLAAVSAPQFLPGLSDRDAAEAVRCGADFKYALGLDLGDPGFCLSVPGDFRDQLPGEGRAGRLPGLALARLELVTEAVRAALEELARTAGHALDGPAGDDWGRRYGRPVRLGKNPARPKAGMNEAGADAAG